LPTSVSGWSSYRVAARGSGLESATGPTHTLGVFRARVASVSPAGKEYVAVRNSGAIAVQLGGWRLRDRSGRSVRLPSFACAPGTVVKVFTGSGRSTAHRVYLGRHADLWAAHDTVRLLDRAGAAVAKLRY
jgi:hypothetical protein